MNLDYLKAQQAYSPPTFEEIIKKQQKTIDELDKKLYSLIDLLNEQHKKIKKLTEENKILRKAQEK